MDTNKIVRRRITWEIITPMFGGEASPDEVGVRESSFKGLLRWWWRTTGGISDVGLLHRREGELFGQVHGDTQIKSPLSIYIDDSALATSAGFAQKTGGMRGEHMGTSDTGKPIYVHGTKFLTYGAWKLGAHGNDRLSVAPGQRFKMLLKYPIGYESEYNRALKAFHLYGGMGMKSRNALGQIQIVEDDRPMADLDQGLVGDSNQRGRDFASLGHETLITHDPYSNWDDALYDLGMFYYKSKSNLHENEKNIFAGHNPKQLGLERKATAAQLFIKKTADGQYLPGLITLPQELISRGIKSGEHNDVLKKFEAGVKQVIQHSNGDQHQ